MMRAIWLVVIITTSIGADWEFVRREEGITVERKLSNNSSVMMFRGRTVLDARISELMAVVLDPDTQREWNNTGYDMRILQKNSDTDLWFYSALRAPWPFRDRDFVIKLETVMNPNGRRLQINGIEAEHTAAPMHPRRIRMPVSRISWELIALKNNRTEVAVTFQIDAGGALPLWLMHKVTKGMPFRGLRNIRELIRERGYNADFRKRFAGYDRWH